MIFLELLFRLLLVSNDFSISLVFEKLTSLASELGFFFCNELRWLL